MPVNPHLDHSQTSLTSYWKEHARPFGAPQAATDLQLFEVRTSETYAALEAWKELNARFPDAALACSFDWTQTWLTHYGDAVHPRFIIAQADQQVQGICLLTKSKQQKFGPFTLTSLHLGTAGEPDGTSVCVEYNDLLVNPIFRSAFVSQLQTGILQEADWDQFQLDGIPCEDAAWPLWNQDPAEKNSTQFPVKETHIRVRESRFFDLASCRQQGAEILSLLGKSTKSNLKRRLNQIGPVTVEWAETPVQAENIFEELVSLHQARWQAVGQPGAFANSRFEKFQRELIARLCPQQRVALVRIKANGTTIGCLYLLVDRNRLLDYVSGLISFEEFPSPGLISHYLCLKEALERGYDAYDFLVGEKRHKENLGKSSQSLQWIVCERNRTKFLLRDGARTCKQLLKKAIRKS